MCPDKFRYQLYDQMLKSAIRSPQRYIQTGNIMKEKSLMKKIIIYDFHLFFRQTCASLLRDLPSQNEWNPAIITSSCIQPSASQTDSLPDWDIIKETVRCRPLLAWLRQTARLWCIDERWCFRTSVYQRSVSWFQSTDPIHSLRS